MTDLNENISGDPEVKANAQSAYSREYVEELKQESIQTRAKAKAREAQWLEAEKDLKIQLEEANSKLTKAEQSRRVDVATAKIEALAVKEGIVDVDTLALLDHSKLEFDENGKIKNAVDILKAFKEAKPHLFGSVATSSTAKPPTAAKSQPQSFRDSPEEWAREKKRLGL